MPLPLAPALQTQRRAGVQVVAVLQRHSGIEHLDLGQIQLDLAGGSPLLRGVGAQTRLVLEQAHIPYRLVHTSLGCLRGLWSLCKVSKYSSLAGSLAL